MAYLSALIQYVTKPDLLYLLIYQHRMALIWFSMVMGGVLTLRFGLIGFGFTLLYEATKGYLFGDRFLAEAFIVYPLVYLIFLSFLDRPHVPIARVMESVWVALSVWFVVFAREPYVPLALVLFGIQVIGLWKNSRKMALVTVAVFLLLSIGTIATHDIKEYFYNVITLNQLTIAKMEVEDMSQANGGFIPIIASPMYQFFGGIWNSFRRITVSLSALFLFSMALFIFKTKRWGTIATSFLLLSLANVRPIAPGQVYYAAFHGIVWYATLIVLTLVFLHSLAQEKKVLGVGLWIIFGALVVFVLIDPNSYLHERVDRQTEFTTNYAQYQSTGDTVAFLSTPADTLFLDGWDDLIYWQARRLSPYRYSWYTSIMQGIPRYLEVRAHMFLASPPTFYYGKCVNGVLDTNALPDEFSKTYVRLIASGKPTCLFVKRAKLSKISDTQWESVKKYGVAKPDSFVYTSSQSL